MTPALLERVGHALYGEFWAAPLAFDLDVQKNTLRKWAAGKSRIPPGLADELHTLLAERMGEIRAVKGEVEVAIARVPAAPDVSG